MAIAEFCEGVLLDAGFVDEAYARYAVEATYSTTNLATFKAVAKKYPGIPKETILRDLVASQPGQEGKWFAAAKDSGLFELAIELANKSPADPRTLIRAARDFAVKHAFSAPNWTPIPRQTGHPVQRKLDTDSAPNWTV